MKNNIFFIFISLIILFFTSPVFAQVNQKYLTGAVPQINGKVTFTDSLVFPGLAQEIIYSRAINWANANYNTETSKVVYTDEEKGIISCRCESELIFQSSALSLDKSVMNYQLTLFCENGSLKTEIKNINYLYDSSSNRGLEKIAAEKWITDKEAVNKNKLYRHSGKFRIKTIDLVEDINISLAISINTGINDLYTEKENQKINARNLIANQNLPLQENLPPQTKKTEITYNLPSGEGDLSSFKQFEADKIPGNIIKMLENDWMLITAGNEEKFNMMTASWGGLGFFWGKPVSFCFINPARFTYGLMENNDYYTLSFYTEAYRETLRYCGSKSGKDTDKIKESGLTPLTLPSGSKAFKEAWMIIECKKIVGQQLTEESAFDENEKEKWKKSAFHKMYIGEIINVWIK